MKHSLSSHLLILGAPVWALTTVCTAQTLTPAPAPPPQRTVLPVQDLHNTGTVSAYDASGLTVLEPATGSMTVYMTNADTMFVDTHGRLVPPDRITLQTPVNVHYTPVGQSLLATKIVVNAALTTDGTLIEIDPGVLVVQLSGVPGVQVRYVNSSTLKFVDAAGTTLPVQSMTTGMTVRVFYTKAGDALVATKVQLLDVNGVSSVTSKTTTTTVTTRSSQR